MFQFLEHNAACQVGSKILSGYTAKPATCSLSLAVIRVQPIEHRTGGVNFLLPDLLPHALWSAMLGTYLNLLGLWALRKLSHATLSVCPDTTCAERRKLIMNYGDLYCDVIGSAMSCGYFSQSLKGPLQIFHQLLTSKS